MSVEQQILMQFQQMESKLQVMATSASPERHLEREAPALNPSVGWQLAILLGTAAAYYALFLTVYFGPQDVSLFKFWVVATIASPMFFIYMGVRFMVANRRSINRHPLLYLPALTFAFSPVAMFCWFFIQFA